MDNIKREQNGDGFPDGYSDVTRKVAYNSETNIYVHIGSVLSERYQLTDVLTDQRNDYAIFYAKMGAENVVVQLYYTGHQPSERVLTVLHDVPCPHIMPIIDTGWAGDRFYVVTPYYENGDLQWLSPLDPQLVADSVVPAVNQALHVLHQQNLTHCHVRPNHLFLRVNDEGQRSAVLGDVLGVRLSNSRYVIHYGKSLRPLVYAAPEALQGFACCEADYYSLGVTLWHLCFGHDLFIGLSEQQILKAITLDNFPLPPTVPKRLAELIHGLTLKERQDRWGFEQVQSWCRGEKVEIRERMIKVAKPYIINDQEIHQLPELALAFARNWEEGKKHLYRKLVSDHLRHVGRQDLSSKAMDCEEEENQDLGLFNLIYTLYPVGPLCWKGEVFYDFNKFGRAVANQLPEINEHYLEMLHAGALVSFLQFKNHDHEMVKQLAELQDLATRDPETAYYKMHFLLNETCEFCFENNSFYTVDELVDFLHSQRHRLDELGGKLLQQKYFFVWLDHLGMKEQIDRWRDHMIISRWDVKR